MKANEFVKKHGLEKSKMAVRKLLPMEEGMPVFDYNSEDLKRLVESHELVEKVGGMDKAKMLLRMRIAAEIEKAIAGVESCL